MPYDWRIWGRDEQQTPPGTWSTWAIIAGRGWGKTRVGVEAIRALIEGPSPLIAPKGAPARIALVGETEADVRDVMIDGESGFMACTPKDYRPTHIGNKRRLVWPNGVRATLFSSMKPDTLRGPQHHLAWCDELAKFKYPQLVWDNLQMGLRLGDNPRNIVTTTPRPIPILKELLADPTTFITKGTTYDNASNLPDKFIKAILKKYEGTRIGRQELMADLLDDVPGALFQRAQIDRTRRPGVDFMADGHPAFPFEARRVVVAVDPAVSVNENSNETGIIVAGADFKDQGYVLDDLSMVGSPNEWATAAVAAYHRYEADAIVAEVNQGGDMVKTIILGIDPTIRVITVHASHGKVARAEPISSAHEQGRIHHCGTFGVLEDQMCAFTTDFDVGTAGYSPDRVDALVWAFTELLLTKKRKPSV